MRKITLLVAGLALLVLALPTQSRADACPQAASDPGGSISGFSNSPYTTNAATPGNNCNLIITFKADGSISTTVANAAPYDGLEDQLVGVINLTANPITTIALSNLGSTIFGFDHDGICAYVPFASNAGAGTCNGSSTATTADPGDYLGTASSFSNISAGLDSGSVNWANPIAGSGGTGYFSLELPASLNLRVNQTPEPSSLFLLGSGLVSLLGFARRRLAA